MFCRSYQNQIEARNGSSRTDPNERYLVRGFPLAPNEDRTVTGEYMTDGGSNDTAEYGLNADTPQTAPPMSCP